MKKILSVILVLTLFVPSFAALQKSRTVYNKEYSFHWLANVDFDRRGNEAVATLYLYDSKEHYQNEPNDYVKKLRTIIPFSAFTAQELLQIKNITERAIKRSILNDSEIETNWYNDAEIVSE